VSGERVGCETAWWLDPKVRGGSTSLRMLDAAEQWALDEACSAFQMIAPEGSSVGRLYARRGYVPVETVWQLAL
jgi:hypothetical protein